MKSKYKGVMWILLIAIVLVGGYFAFTFFVSQTNFSPGVTPLGAETEFTGTSCDADKCIVRAEMTLDKAPSATQLAVVYRTNVKFSTYDAAGSWIAFDTGYPKDGFLEGYDYDFTETVPNTPESYSPTIAGDYVRVLPDGAKLIVTSSNGIPYIRIYKGEFSNVDTSFTQKYKCNCADPKLQINCQTCTQYIWSSEVHYTYYVFDKSSNTAVKSVVPTAPYSTTSGQEITTTSNSPTVNAYFDFCPGSTTSAYCGRGTSAGALSFVSAPNANQPPYVTQDSVELSRGATISFNPKYADGTLVTNKKMYIRRGDTTCLKNIASGATCDATSDKVMCEGYINYCAKGNFSANEYCDYLDGSRSYGSGKTNVCAEDKNGYTYCYTPAKKGNTFKYCDGTTTISGQSCYAYKTVGTCTGAQNCVTDAGGTIGVGLGGCKCVNSICKLGDSESNTADNHMFRECITDASGCTGWGDWQNCDSGLLSRFIAGKCAVDATEQCNLGAQKCISNNMLQKCITKTIATKTGTVTASLWDSGTACSGDTICNTVGTTASCNCNGVDSCGTGTSSTSLVKCISDTTYSQCTTNGANTCNAYRGSLTVAANYQCTGDKLVPKPGCANNNPPCETDYNCVSNICTLKSTGEYCAGTEAKKCLTVTNQTTTNQIQTCTRQTSGAYKWITSTCNADYTCSNGACTPLTTGTYCSSTAGPRCVNASSTLVETCTKQSSGAYKWVQSTCGTDKSCSGGQCLPFGCAYPTSGVTCNADNFEVCTSNTCACKQDEFTASATNYNENTKICSGNTVKQAVKYNNCYRWETYIAAPNSNSGVCTGNYQCNLGACTPSNEFIGLLGQDTFGIGQKINATVKLTPKVGDVSNVKILAYLSENDKEISGTRLNVLTDNTGAATLTFAYTSSRSANLLINIVAGDPAGVNYKATRSITILKTLDVKPTCDTISFVGRDAKCTWTIKDIDSKALISTASLDISLKQGTIEVPYSATSTGLTFSAASIGNVVLTLRASAAGYIDGISTSNIPVQETQRTATLAIDGQDYASFAASNPQVGLKTLEFNILESGLPADVQEITATITTPAGQAVPIVFTKNDEGKYTSSFNLLQPGMTYQLAGEIQYNDITKPNTPFSYSITTTGTPTSDLGGLYNTIIYGIIGGVAAFIIVIVIILVARKKK